MATWKKWTSTVLVNGQPEPNVEVHVYEPGTTNEITVYEDEGVTPITQPILTDSQGRYAFFVDVDTYPEIRLYLEKDGVDFSEANEDLDGVPVPGAGAGAGTFLELTDTPSSYVGRGGDVVLVKTTEDGIETQPWPVTGTILNFFLSDDAADIGGYYYMYPTESGNGYSELTSPSLSTGDDQLLWAFVTEAGEPGVEVLALGAYTATLFLRKSGNKDVRVYWKLFKRDTGGTETEILQSAVSDYLTADNSQYLISAYLNEDQVLDPTDRLVLKLYANVSGTGTDVTVTLTMEGDYDSRLTINVLSSAFNLDRLSDVTISSPEDDEVLAYDSGSGKWINQTPSEAGLLAADGSVPLTADWDVGGHSLSSVLSLDQTGQGGQTGYEGAFRGVADARDFGAVLDGTTDDSAAIQAAIDSGLGIVVVPYSPSGTRIANTINLNGTRRVFLFYSDVFVDVPSGDPGFLINGDSRNIIRFYGRCYGNAKTNDFLKLRHGINNNIFINRADTFRYAIYLKQEAEGETLTENIISYNYIGGNTKNVYIPSPPSGQSTIPIEGLELRGGSLFDADYGIHIEPGIDAKYMLVTGTIDCGAGNYDFVNEGENHVLILAKWLTEANCIFGPGDIVFDMKKGCLKIYGSAGAPGLALNPDDAPSQVISGFKYIQHIRNIATPNTREGLLIGSSGLGSSDAVSLNVYTDVKDGTASGEKEGGLQLAYRRNDDASAVAGGRIAIVKIAGSDKSKFQFFTQEGIQIAELDDAGNLKIAGTVTENATF